MKAEGEVNRALSGDLIAGIIQKARALGASSAGMTSCVSLKGAPSYLSSGLETGLTEDFALLVLGLAHDRGEPELDWWDGRKGTAGNRRLIGISEGIKTWLQENYGIRSRNLPYHLERGGVLLKDAAVMAGLGVIGLNNLLITPEWGPRIRLRAMIVQCRHPSKSPRRGFQPCDGCERTCWEACPQEAFRDGSYSKNLCSRQMGLDKKRAMRSGVEQERGFAGYIKHCRACELACPVG